MHDTDKQLPIVRYLLGAISILFAVLYALDWLDINIPKMLFPNSVPPPAGEPNIFPPMLKIVIAFLIATTFFAKNVFIQKIVQFDRSKYFPEENTRKIIHREFAESDNTILERVIEKKLALVERGNEGKDIYCRLEGYQKYISIIRDFLGDTYGRIIMTLPRSPYEQLYDDESRETLFNALEHVKKSWLRLGVPEKKILLSRESLEYFKQEFGRESAIFFAKEFGADYRIQYKDNNPQKTKVLRDEGGICKYIDLHYKRILGLRLGIKLRWYYSKIDKAKYEEFILFLNKAALLFDRDIAVNATKYDKITLNFNTSMYKETFYNCAHVRNTKEFFEDKIIRSNDFFDIYVKPHLSGTISIPEVKTKVENMIDEMIKKW